MPKEAQVDAQNQDYKDMVERWALPVALKGGTPTMRSKRETYLPKFEAESTKAYNNRLKQTTLFNGYWRTIRALSGQPFQEPVQLQNAAPLFEAIAEDVDLSGTDITGFGRQLLDDMLLYGKAHFTVDLPNIDKLRQEKGRNLTLAEETALKVRPYFTRVDPSQLFAWRGIRVGGVETMEQIRIMETVAEPVGEWGEEIVQKIRVWTPEQVVLYVKKKIEGEGLKWVPDEGVANELGKVPLATAYAIRTGLLKSLPPLEDLAWINLEHYQSASDQNNILHFARAFILAFMGFQKEEVETVEIGAGRGIASTNTDAHIDVVEHSGKAIDAGRQDLLDKKAEMEALGGEMITPRPGTETATARAIDHAESIADLHSMVRNLERALEDGMALAGEWVGVETGELKVDIFQDFKGFDNAKDLAELREDFKMGAIDHRTYLEERKRRGLYSDSMDPDEVISALETANPFDSGENFDFEEGEDEDFQEAAG